MNKQPSSLNQYPAGSTLCAESALVMAWSVLENFRSDLVVIGGLAIHVHTRDKVRPFYRPTSTLDVDLGVTVGADAGLAASAGFALKLAGFSETKEGRVYRKTELGDLYIDFLTEHPPRKQGSCNVSDLNASICLGLNRALTKPICRPITGEDQFGEKRTFSIPFCNYGALLVLKLNAYANRQNSKKAKDAYDILSLVHSNIDGAEAAVTSFGIEKSSDSSGIDNALRVLETDFLSADSLGPTLAQGFYHGSNFSKKEGVRLREDLVTIALSLLDS